MTIEIGHYPKPGPPMNRFLAKSLGLRVVFRKDLVAEMAQAFDKAKGLSDFIGMIVQLTFTVAFFFYFIQKMSAATSWGYLCWYSTVALLGGVVAIYFWLLISRILSGYFVYLQSFVRHPWGQAVVLFFFLYCYLAVITGIWDISITLARATKLGQ